MKKVFIMLLGFMLAAPVLADMSKAEEAFDNKDYKTALELLQIEAQRNQVKAAYLLGIMYRDGLGVPRDPERALKWFTEAAESNWIRAVDKLGSPEAQYEAGIMYRDGIGTEKDLNKAADWFEQAAGQGHSLSQEALGEMYLRGEGVDVNYELAYFWSGLAADSLSEAIEKERVAREQATRTRDEAAKKLTPNQLEQVKKKIEKWEPD